MSFKRTSDYFILAIIVLTSISSCNIPSKSNKIKINSKFVDTTWLLESIEGDKIVYPADYKQNYITFTPEAKGFKFSGFAGCNNISGKYDVGDHGEIGIQDILSTRKTCSFIKLENRFLGMLKEITSYKIDGYYITLYNGDKKVASLKDSKELSTH